MFISTRKLWSTILIIFVMLVVILVAFLVFIPSRAVESVENSTELNQSLEWSGAYISTTDPFDKNANQSEKISQDDLEDEPEDESEGEKWLKDSGDLRPSFMPRSFGSVDKWPKLNVTWKFNDTSHKVPHQVNNVLREAAARWSNVTTLTLVETNDTKSDIEICFLRTSDVKPGTDINGGDGPYSSHSTGPKSPRCYIHFNAAAKWEFYLNPSNQSNVRPLLRSAMFGFGITLGLAKTNHTNSVMNADTNLTILQEDDINRLQELYGMFEEDRSEDLSADESTTADLDVLTPHPQTPTKTTWNKTLIIQKIQRRSRHPRLPARLRSSLDPKVQEANVEITIQNIIIL